MISKGMRDKIEKILLESVDFGANSKTVWVSKIVPQLLEAFNQELEKREKKGYRQGVLDFKYRLTKKG